VIRPTIEEFEALVGTPAGEVLAAV
jgi:hypothetical protein